MRPSRRNYNSKSYVRLLFLICIALIHSCADPEDPSSIDLIGDLSFESDALYTFADGRSGINFQARIYDKKGNLLSGLMNRMTIRLGEHIVSQGEESYQYTPHEEGIFDFLLEIDSTMLGSKQIHAVRPRRAEVPVIFHISESLPTEVSETISSLIDALNEKLNNHSPNSGVNDFAVSHIQFKLVEHTPDGQVLGEPGISRYPQEHEEFKAFVEEWQRDHYWNPEHYVNIWIGKHPGYGILVRRTHFPNDLAPGFPRRIIPEPRSYYRITRYFEDPPMHQPEGIKFTYIEDVNSILADQNLNQFILLIGKFFGLDQIRQQTGQKKSNYMNINGTEPKNHFTVAQVGRMWLTLDLARWRANKGIIFHDRN